MLETDRLLLRPWREQEAVVMRELWTERDPRVPAHRRIDADDRPNLGDLTAWIRQNPATDRMGLLAAEVRESSEVIGYCGLIDTEGDPELGFELLQRTWNRGYATEAARAVIENARRSGFTRLTASVWDWNTASRRVLEKLGFAEYERDGGKLFTALRLA